MSIAIGIDLGTTNTCVGCFHGGKLEIIENKTTSNNTTPSIVSFTSKDHIIGKPPRISSLENTVYEVKRLMGRTSDEIINENIKRSYDVVNKDGWPHIQVTYKGEQTHISPEQVSSMILKEMKDNSSKHLGQEVTKAVITVPAYFNMARTFRMTKKKCIVSVRNVK